MVNYSVISLALTASAQSLPPDAGQCSEVSIGRARLKLSGNLIPAMLSALVRELKRGG